MNLTTQEQKKFGVLVSDHYQYSRSGADFTVDMHEKTLKDKLPKPVTNSIFTASKRLEMGRSPTHTFDNLTEYSNNFIRPESTTMTGYGSEEDSLEEHSGINSVSRVKVRSVYLEHDVKNPKDFDEFVDRLVDRYIPCILFAPRSRCSKLLIFYHANAEDIGLALEFCEDINKKLEVK